MPPSRHSIGHYLIRTFQIHISCPLMVAHTLASYWGLQAITQTKTLTAGPKILLCTVVTCLCMLLVRAYDELKDSDHDLARAAEGDPEYTNRPLVIGQVTLKDIKAVRWFCSIVLVLCAPFLGKMGMLTLAVWFVFCWLTYKWFFCPSIAHNRLLALITHLPVYYLALNLLPAAIFIQHSEKDTIGAYGHIYLIGLWLSNAIWETARKTRLPEEESGFQSYSQLLGWQHAIWLPVIFLSLSLLGVTESLASNVALPIYPHLLQLTGLVLLITAVRVRLKPRPTYRVQLRVAAEIFLLVLWVGLPIALVLERGLVWSPLS